MLLKHVHLFFCKVLFVLRVSFKWQGVIRELWMFFVIYIQMSILPVRELCLISTLLLRRGFILYHLSRRSLLWSYLKWLIRCFISSWAFHRMRVNSFMFFFMIKGIFLWKYLSFFKFSMIFFLIVSNHAFGIWIFHKSICTSCFSSYWSTSNRVYNLI